MIVQQSLNMTTMTAAHRGPRTMGKKSTRRQALTASAGHENCKLHDVVQSGVTKATKKRTSPTLAKTSTQSSSSSPSSSASSSESSDPYDEAYAYHRRAAAELNNTAIALVEASKPRLAIKTLGEAIRASKRAHSLLEQRAASIASGDLNDNESDCDGDASSPSSHYDCDARAMAALGVGVSQSYQAMDAAHGDIRSALHDIDAKEQSESGADDQGSLPAVLRQGLRGTRGLLAYTAPVRLAVPTATGATSSAASSLPRSSSNNYQRILNAIQASESTDLASIMFNMALVHHIRGCEQTGVGPTSATNSAGEKPLKKALTTYLLVQSLLSQVRNRMDSLLGSDDNISANKNNEAMDEIADRIALLNVALLNNMGQILSELGQPRIVVSPYFDGLSRLLLSDQQSPDGTTKQQQQQARRWNGFELNVLHCLSFPSPAA